MTTLQMWILVGVVLFVRGMDETVAYCSGLVILIACAGFAVFR